jgi:hypothetical protein
LHEIELVVAPLQIPTPFLLLQRNCNIEKTKKQKEKKNQRKEKGGRSKSAKRKFPDTSPAT